MKIVFFIELLAGAVGGAERALLGHASELARRGHQVSIATHGPKNGAPFYSFDQSVLILNLNEEAQEIAEPRAVEEASKGPATAREDVALPRSRKLAKVLKFKPREILRRLELRSPWLRQMLFRRSAKFGRISERFEHCIREQKADVVVGFLPFVAPFLAEAAQRTKTPAVFSLRNTPDRNFAQVNDSKRDLETLLFLDSLPRFDQIHYLIPSFRLGFPGTVDPDRLVCIPNVVDVERVDWDHLPHVSERPKSILSVGRLIQNKRPQWILEAFILLAQEFPDWRLEFFGEGPLKSALQKRAQHAGLAGRIIFNGAVQDLNAIYGSGRIFCLASRMEGMPNALAEAMTAELACIGAGDCDGARFLLEAGGGEIVYDLQGLAGTMRATMRSEERLRERAAAARARAVEMAQRDVHGEWEAMLQGLVDRARLSG